MRIPSALFAALLITGFTFISTTVFSEDTKKTESTMNKVVEKTKEAAKDTGRAIKKGARKLDDKACTMIKGELKCAGQKAEHAVENLKDKVQDATE